MTSSSLPARAADSDIVARLCSDGMVPLFGSSEPAHLRKAAEAALDAGLGTLEVTLRSPGALGAFADLAAWADRVELPLVLGVGTVLDARVATDAIGAGARFVFSPVVSTEIAERCQAAGVPYFPGCATPTEIHRARELGCEVVKIFPAATVGGPSFLRSVRAVFPSLLAVPTGGVAPEEAELVEWFRAGACAVGLGSAVFAPDMVSRGDWDAMKRRLMTASVAVAEARKSRP